VNLSQTTAQTAETLRALSPAFLEKYNKSGPRYTSYPTAPEWSERVSSEDFRRHIRTKGTGKTDASLSLYFHIPFCEHRCRFCACNTIITEKREVIPPYLSALDREMGIIASEMETSGQQTRPVTQIHFGGGTPTYLSPQQFVELMSQVRHYFHVVPDAEISIEVDPCVTTDEHIHTLAELGFNRISFGVQDFNPDIQELIERVQSVELTKHFTELSRKTGYHSVNFDLVYGLPLQRVETFGQTLDEVLRLRPDRIALYNFAYLPGKLAHQRYLNPGILPNGQEKFRIFVAAYERFTREGYEYIGMDHFAVPEDPLSEARRNGTIQRNFMGYTTQAGTDLYAFGVSSISATESLYVQNTRKLNAYQKSVLQDGQLPIERGVFLSEDDRIRKEVIYSLMCYGRVIKEEISKEFGISFDDYFSQEIPQLPAFERDGLLSLSSDIIQITLLGHIFVRNIAMVFDKYLRVPRKQPTFSRTL